MKSIARVVVCGMCFAELACSSDSAKPPEAQRDAATDATTPEGSGGAPAFHDAALEVSTGGTRPNGPETGPPSPEASADSATSACPTGLDCVTPTGVYICENPGPSFVTCEAKNGCPFGACVPLSGQGVCLQLCQPSEGLPSTTQITGVVTEFEAGKGLVGTTEAPKETPLADVQVCLREPKLGVPCVKTDEAGKFALIGVPPNRNLAVAVTAFVSFEKAGYLSLLRGTALGNGDQTLSPQTRMNTMAQASAMATALGVSLPDAKTGWLGLGALALNPEGAKRLSAFSEGTAKEITVEDATFSMEPAPGSGPFYADAMERFESRDAAADRTSIAGFGYFFDVPAGKYDLAVMHPTLDCGGALNVEAVPGFVFSYIDALCGKGVK